jgi:enoyl-CoA hydratase/carnithine racemase
LASQRIPASSLLSSGFANEVLPAGDDLFLPAVMQRVDAMFGPKANLEPGSVKKVKALMQSAEKERVEAANVREHWEGLGRFAAGIPQKRAAAAAARMGSKGKTKAQL